MRDRFARQPGLFDNPTPSLTGSLVDQLDEHPGEDFIQGIRDELQATLELAKASITFPWPDLTRTYMAELRFNSMSNWLPGGEASRLREDFRSEMDRLYETADEMRPEVPNVGM